jgi:uncharacterized heparinase superfamily protein
LRRRGGGGRFDAGAAGAGLRATAAHSTLTLDDANSTAVLINGGLGNGVAEVEVDRRTLEGEGTAGSWGATRLEASHDGYAARYGLIHRRILILRDDGTELRGEDMLVPQGRKGKRGMVGFAIRFTLGRDRYRAVAGQAGCGSGSARWQLLAVPCGLGRDRHRGSIWADGQGRPVPVQQIVIQGMISRGGGNFAWLLKKMG